MKQNTTQVCLNEPSKTSIRVECYAPSKQTIELQTLQPAEGSNFGGAFGAEVGSGAGAA